MTHETTEARPTIPPQSVGLDERALHLPTTSEQRTARIMGAWFLGTFLFSIPAFFFYGPILDDVDFIVGSGNDTRVGVGALLEILLAVSGIATAVVIYPIVKRVSQSVALGYIASRTVESMLILIGVLSLTAVVALHQDLDAVASTNETLTDVGRALVALHEQTRLLGPQFCAGLGNGILLGYLMWRSRLLPRPMVMFGLVGGPLALSVWLLVKGFRPHPSSQASASETGGSAVQRWFRRSPGTASDCPLARRWSSTPAATVGLDGHRHRFGYSAGGAVASGPVASSAN